MSSSSGSTSSQSAFRLLSTQLGVRVKIYLTEGGYITGILRGYDMHMNVVVEDGELTSEIEKIKIGNLILRGAAIVAITSAD